MKNDFDDSMPKNTQAIFQKISSLGGVKDFVLIGGTALSLHLKHRLSEDLDFCSTTGLTLNKNQINNIINHLKDSGSNIEQVISIKDKQDFEISGEDIMDYHQTYIVDGVKMDFFVMTSRLLREDICSKEFNEILPGIKVADIDILFDLKANVILNRTKSRDFFDIQALIKKYNYFTYADLISSIKNRSECHLPEEFIFSKLLPNRFSLNDEGLEGLVDDINDNEIQDELIGFFRTAQETYKISLTEDILASSSSGPCQ